MVWRSQVSQQRTLRAFGDRRRIVGQAARQRPTQGARSKSQLQRSPFLRIFAQLFANRSTLSSPLSFLGDLRPGFVAHLAERLVDAICTETQRFADTVGIVAPVKTHSALLYLLIRGPASLVEIARSDDQSHQLVASRLAPLEAMGLIERFADPDDQRRKPYKLTAAGRDEAAKVRAAIAAHAKAQRELARETGLDLVALLDQALALQADIRLSARIARHHRRPSKDTAR
jgi:DNA-binding MarR family transcriptional regulator